MPGVPDADDPAWGKFFEFLEPPEVPATAEAADKGLRGRGIDVGALRARVLATVKRAKARRELAAARVKAAAVRGAATPATEAAGQVTRARLQEIIAARCDGEKQLVYFRRLDESASDADLQSLLTDLDLLDTLPGDERRAEDPGQ